MSELISHTDCEEFFDQVLALDKKIRYVAIYDGEYHAKFQDGIQGYFKEDEIKSSLVEAQSRWAYRKKMSFTVGVPRFAMAQYAKVNRITFPLGTDGVILVTTELGVDIEKLVDKIIEFRYPLNINVTGLYTR